uniref:E3 SUMO-protein ligase PIAS2-like isoform X3 n=1 Tax=Styela clava TaxID=7725 RepID=UPI001939394F|nr:E3 SUMO-protein ligase PIAS2-like isoform X3 [Styela clava]
MSSDREMDVVELKHMVMSFRVSELQVLLGNAGRNKSGRKHDLMSRALQLLKHGCSSSIQQSIQELYHRRFPRSKAAQHMSTLGHDKHMDYESHFKDSHYKDKKKIHDSEYRNMDIGPIHPDVRFKCLPFYDILSDVLKPTSLITKAHKAYSKTELSFTLTEEQRRTIRHSRKERGNPRYHVQVQLRFCLMETSCDQKDIIPPNLCVQVNRQIATLPPYIPPSKAGVEPKRACRPIDITLLCKLSDTSYNNIEITWTAEHGKNFATCINVVRPLSSEELLQRLRKKGIRNAGHSTALIREKLAPNPDSEIATTSLKVSLLCPLGKMRMTIPARPVTCTHMQCFDAMLFLQMNEKKPTWICPVCDKPADFINLFIDGLFMDILKETSAAEIVFLDDGRWEPFKAKKESYSLCTPSKNSNTIALDLSNSPQSPTSVEAKRKEPEIIDLTGDSSDDERAPSPPKRQDFTKDQDEVHSLSSTSPYRSDSSVMHVDSKRTPTPTWEPSRESTHSAGLPTNIFSSNSSPRPSSYGHIDITGRTSHPSLSYSVPGSRDSTPPGLHHSLSSLLNPGFATFHNPLDYTQSALDFNLSYLQSFGADPLRRIPGEHSARSSPFLMNPSPNHLYQPPVSTRSSSSTNDHISRSYLTSYTPHYHPYSPISYLQTSAENSDVIPID